MDRDSNDTVFDALQITPALTVSGITLLGISLHDWVYIVTIIYTFIGIVTIIKKHWYDPWKNSKKEEDEIKDE